MKPTLLISIVTLALSLAGCTTAGSSAKFEVLNETRKAIDRNTTATIAVGLGTVTDTTAPIEAAATKIGEATGAADARFEELRKELEKQKLEFTTFVNGALSAVGEIATDLVPGGSTAAKVIGIVQNRITSAKQAAEEATKQSEVAKKDAAAAAVDAQKQIASLKADVAAKEDILKQQIAAKEEMQKRELELARKELAALTMQQQAELRQELVTIAKENGVNGADGMSTEELLAALGAGGLGLAGLLRTFGRSRSATKVEEIAATQGDQTKKVGEAVKEVDEIWTEMKDLQSKVDVIKQRADGTAAFLTTTSQVEVEVTLKDHGRRIEKLESKVG